MFLWISESDPEKQERSKGRIVLSMEVTDGLISAFLKFANSMETRRRTSQKKYVDIFGVKSLVETEKIVGTVRKFMQIWELEGLVQLQLDVDSTDRRSALMDKRQPAKFVVSSPMSMKTFCAVESDWFFEYIGPKVCHVKAY